MRSTGSAVCTGGNDYSCGFGLENPDGSYGCERAGCDYTEADE